MAVSNRAVSGRGARMVALGALFACSCDAVAQPSFIQQGKAGFVVSDIKYVLGEDADKTGACSRGMSRNVADIFGLTKEGKRRKGESDQDYGKRLEEGGKRLATAPNGQNLCMNPEAGGPDPYFRTLDATDVPVEGLDLDGADSNTADPPPRGACQHQDFHGPHGERGIDNQFYRVVGCSRSFQSSGQSNTFATEMLTGAWGILITLSGVDDLRNDNDVEVGLFANADPIQLSPNRQPLPYATYAMDQDRRFRARAHGRIKDGILTTDPVDVRFHRISNGLHFDRPLLHARLQATISSEGVLTGYLAGYTPVEALYDYQFGYRNGKNAKGEPGPLPLRLGTANGAARVLGYTCTGVYNALYQYADADKDPQSGRCTSISTQYRISAIPAFVVDVATHSSNSKPAEQAKADVK
jgi:hypothetical protein